MTIAIQGVSVSRGIAIGQFHIVQHDLLCEQTQEGMKLIPG